ncbi:MAG: phosphotyrosine protein phosphatase [Pseudomonadota bacterium]
MRILFVCTANRLRSATAETVFHGKNGVEAIGAGTDRDAPTTVSGDLIEWADVVVVMEKMHRNKISKKFRPLLKNKRLVVLGIPDDYDYMQPELVRLLEARVSRILRV